MKVSINLVTYNSLKYLDDCLKSIFNQTFRDFKILVVDNNSGDGTVEHLRRFYPDVTVLQNFKNLGFCKGQNQAIKFWSSDYVLLVNPDTILQPNCLQQLVDFVDANPDVALVGGKSLKLNEQEENPTAKRPDLIDSTGIFATKARRFYERGSGEPDRGQYDKTEEVFGVSGNLALYRRSALEAVKLKNIRAQETYKFTSEFTYYEYFDEDFFMYKDDVDMAYRLHLAGWQIYYLPTAEVYHYRAAYGQAKNNDSTIIRDRRSKSQFINRHSYKNHWLVLFKDESWVNFFLALPWIGFYELKKFVYILFAETSTLATMPTIFALLPVIFNKRRQIKKLQKINVKEMRRWFK